VSHPLFEVKIKLISACNYRCQMCGHWREPVTRLTTEEVIRAVREAAELGARSVIFSGGEPTLHKGLTLAVREAAALGMRVTLATNGGGLAAGKLEALCEAGVSQFNVSIDSPVAEVHDHIRGIPGSFEEILAGAARAAALGRPVAVKTVVSRPGFRTLAGAPALADRVPIHSLSLTLLTANEPIMLPLALGRADLEEYFFGVLPEILESAAARKLPVKLFPIFRALLGLKPAPLAAELRRRRPADFDAELAAFALGRYGEAFAQTEPCPVLRGKTLVRPDGGIFFCCEVSHTGDFNMGSVREGGAGLRAGWESGAYAALRTEAPTPVHEKCRSCTEWFSRPPEALVKIAAPRRAEVSAP
jgi:sulfatase maturation enzyme AslB (radical SAM superfamily)